MRIKFMNNLIKSLTEKTFKFLDVWHKSALVVLGECQTCGNWHLFSSMWTTWSGCYYCKRCYPCLEDFEKFKRGDFELGSEPPKQIEQPELLKPTMSSRPCEPYRIIKA